MHFFINGIRKKKKLSSGEKEGLETEPFSHFWKLLTQPTIKTSRSVLIGIQATKAYLWSTYLTKHVQFLKEHNSYETYQCMFIHFELVLKPQAVQYQNITNQFLPHFFVLFGNAYFTYFLNFNQCASKLLWNYGHNFPELFQPNDMDSSAT
jgi:hypothetical protein